MKNIKILIYSSKIYHLIIKNYKIKFKCYKKHTVNIKFKFKNTNFQNNSIKSHFCTRIKKFTIFQEKFIIKFIKSK
jgi:hypothetical protein